MLHIKQLETSNQELAELLFSNSYFLIAKATGGSN